MAQQLSVADGFPPDGILGMAFPSLSSLRANPFFSKPISSYKVWLELVLINNPFAYLRFLLL
jgi:hypothetical protein